MEGLVRCFLLRSSPPQVHWQSLRSPAGRSLVGSFSRSAGAFSERNKTCERANTT